MCVHRGQFEIACLGQLQEKLKTIRYGNAINGAYKASLTKLNCSLCAQK